jgi:hypothetical protein
MSFTLTLIKPIISDDCHYAECLCIELNYHECHSSNCDYAGCHAIECKYHESQYTECRSVNDILMNVIF